MPTFLELGNYTPEPTIETAGANSAETNVVGEFSELPQNNIFTGAVKRKIVRRGL